MAGDTQQIKAIRNNPIVIGITKQVGDTQQIKAIRNHF